MKKFALLIVLLLVVAGVYKYLSGDASPGFEVEEGYSLLFDGGSLDGWRVIGGNATFEADGDEIVGRRGPGENTFLRTEQTYGDFNLRMQMRWDEHGNSGVLFRAQQRDGDGRAYGYQYELDPSDRAWSGGIYDEARRGWLANLENKPEARAAIRLDDWNDVEIEARGASLKTWINGVPAADIIDGLDAEGFIALQVHAGETGVIRWRHIRIKEMPGMAAPGESLLVDAEWRLEDLGEPNFGDNGFSMNVVGEAPRLVSRRQFSDAMMRMTVPVCDDPAVIRIRARVDELGTGSYFAEVRLFDDRAEGRMVNPAGEIVMDPVSLMPADQHRVVAVARGGYVAITVGETDVLRSSESGLPERGELQIEPGNCGDAFTVSDLDWFSLKEVSAEPLFYETLDTEPAPVLTPEEALAAFRIAPGFEIELVAAEPLVGEPVAIAWDEYGRLYAVEMRGYMRDAYGSDSDKPVGQVVRLTDTDGDGQMDQSEVFLGELVNPRAVAVVNEGILVAEPPNLWLCELPDKDALCENKRSLGGYATDAGAANVEHMENGLRQGLDNWLYNSKSSRRMKIQDGELVVEEGLYRGQWGITKDDYGRWFYNHNSTWVQADFVQGEDLVMPGYRALPEGLGVNLTPDPEVFSVRVNPGVNRAYLDSTLREDGRLKTATGASGIVAYRGDQFPEEFSSDIFVPESAGNVVAQFAITEDGVALTATQRLYDDPDWGKRGFLGSTDERFRPVDAMNGPDGALYIIDMYRGIIQDDHFLTDELREQIFQRQLEEPLGLGRIWRVTHSEGADTPAVVLGDATDDELLAALSHDNGWVRDTAQRLLLGRDADVSDALAALATGDATLPAIHALWTLEGRGELDGALVQKVVRIDDTKRQVQALRAGRDALSVNDLLSLEAHLEAAPEIVQMHLVLAMADHAQFPVMRQALVRALQREEGVYVRQALLRAVHGQELAFMADAFAADALAEEDETAPAFLATLAEKSYRALRGDLTSDEAANPALLDLLALAESRTGDNAWQQVAMLKGFGRVEVEEGFVPAQLAAAPPIFADASISEKDPLWNARLEGRVAFTWPGDELALGLTPLSPEQMKLMETGKAFFVNCAACHGDAGQGITGLAPALAGAPWVTGPPEWLGRIILQGMTGPVEVNGEHFDGVMPPHGHLEELDDVTLAGLMTYLRRSWGNKAGPVSEEQAAQIRQASADRDGPWTAAELETVAYDRGYSRYVGKYSIAFVTMTVSEKPDGLHLSVPMYGSGTLAEVGEHTFYGKQAGEEIKLEFVVGETGPATKMIMLRNGERLTIKRKK